MSITCSDLNTNENCTVNYLLNGMNSSDIILPSGEVLFPVEAKNFEVVILKNGSTILQQQFKNTFNGEYIGLYSYL